MSFAHATHSASSSEDDDEMDVDKAATTHQCVAGTSNNSRNSGSLAVILRDTTGWLQHVRSLQETDVIILLTPVVTPISPDPTDISDPFEPLGRSLAKRHARVRQVPYTKRNGITSTHLGFIKRGHVIILCLSLRPGEQMPLGFADITFAVSDNKPCIIVVCCFPIDDNQNIPFPTVIQAAGYSPPALESTAALIFGEGLVPRQGFASRVSQPPEPYLGNSQTPRLWHVEQWNETRDISSVLGLWDQNISGRFALDQETLASLLRRPGYAKHYVVRDTSTGTILGFCATYLAYVDKEGEKLIASLALLLVRSTHRLLGIGLSLHSHAVTQLKRTRGVIRLQFGSTFPRLLFGPPFDIHFDEIWFRKRGWLFNRELPGQGQVISDLVLILSSWRYTENTESGVAFRLASQDDMAKVIETIEETSATQSKMGWFDQYTSLMNGPNVKDIVIVENSGNVMATALTYTPGGSPISSNLPWAGRIGDDVGGVTCICISRPPPAQKNTVITGLLNTCVQVLRSQGMSRMFIDGVAASEVGFLKTLGFEEWAQYRDVWKDV